MAGGSPAAGYCTVLVDFPPSSRAARRASRRERANALGQSQVLSFELPRSTQYAALSTTPSFLLSPVPSQHAAPSTQHSAPSFLSSHPRHRKTFHDLDRVSRKYLEVRVILEHFGSGFV